MVCEGLRLTLKLLKLARSADTAVKDARCDLIDRANMEYQGLAEPFKLDIKVLSDDRSREVDSKPSAGRHLGQDRSMIIWTRKCNLTERVYVDESPYGELRVVKRVAWRDKSVANWRAEMDVMERVSKATG